MEKKNLMQVFSDSQKSAPPVNKIYGENKKTELASEIATARLKVYTNTWKISRKNKPIISKENKLTENPTIGKQIEILKAMQIKFKTN